MLTRRNVLAQALGAPFVFGRLVAAGQEGAASRPTSQPTLRSEVRRALAAADQRGAYCIAVLWPAAAPEQERFSETLLRLAYTLDELYGFTLFLRAVFVCVPRSAWPVPSAENALLLGAGGERQRGTRVAWGEMSSALATLHELMDAQESGERAARLDDPRFARGRAEIEQWRDAPDANAHEKRLIACCEPRSFVLWRWRQATDQRERGRLADVLFWRYVELIDDPTLERLRLPFGVYVEDEAGLRSSCGESTIADEFPHEGGYELCGRPTLARRARPFLRCLTR